MDIKTFKEIFKEKQLRQKLDQIVLNFFGLENTKIIEKKNRKKHKIKIEFILLLDEKQVLKIQVIDTLNILTTSKKIYINLSTKSTQQYFLIINPCYIEIYCNYSLKHLSKKHKLMLIAALFACNKKKQVKKIWKKLKCFTKEERNKILKIIETKKSIFSKDK